MWASLIFHFTCRRTEGPPRGSGPGGETGLPLHLREEGLMAGLMWPTQWPVLGSSLCLQSLILGYCLENPAFPVQSTSG